MSDSSNSSRIYLNYVAPYAHIPYAHFSEVGNELLEVETTGLTEQHIITEQPIIAAQVSMSYNNVSRTWSDSSWGVTAHSVGPDGSRIVSHPREVPAPAVESGFEDELDNELWDPFAAAGLTGVNNIVEQNESVEEAMTLVQDNIQEKEVSLERRLRSKFVPYWVNNLDTDLIRNGIGFSLSLPVGSTIVSPIGTSYTLITDRIQLVRNPAGELKLKFDTTPRSISVALERITSWRLIVDGATTSISEKTLEIRPARELGSVLYEVSNHSKCPVCNQISANRVRCQNRCGFELGRPYLHEFLDIMPDCFNWLWYSRGPHPLTGPEKADLLERIKSYFS